MKIATFNANSIRQRFDIVIDWLDANEPDVLAIQETKVDDTKFPASEFEDAGWHVAFHGQKSYNGLAMISRVPLSNVRIGFGDPLMPEDCRIMSVVHEGVTIINTYVPNGNKVGSEKFDYKLKWLDRFRRYLLENYRPDQPLVWVGDINIAPTPLDVFDSAKHLGGVGHHPLEFAALAGIVEFGFEDLYRKFHTDQGEYTFWEFVIPRAVERGLGWRIDHIYGTKPMVNRCTGCVIDKEPRLLEKPSDHTFVVAEFI